MPCFKKNIISFLKTRIDKINIVNLKYIHGYAQYRPRSTGNITMFDKIQDDMLTSVRVIAHLMSNFALILL